MPQKGKKFASLFERVHWYDIWRQTKYHVIAKPLLRFFPELAQPDLKFNQLLAAYAHGRVLDAGGGEGLVDALLTDAGFDTVLLDSSLPMCKRAFAINPKLSVVMGSAEALPFKSGVFDASILRAVIHHLDNALNGLEEARRVSSVSVILDNISDRRPVMAAMQRMWLKWQDDGGRLLAENDWKNLLQRTGATVLEQVITENYRYFIILVVSWQAAKEGGSINPPDLLVRPL